MFLLITITIPFELTTTFVKAVAMMNVVHIFLLDTFFYFSLLGGQKMSAESKIILEPLTPILLDDEQKEKLNYKNYESVLDTIMASEKLCNIALAGPYGAGKSTIMNTYEQEHKDINAIHISLAKFNDEDVDNTQAKLINQIIHQIEPKLIPQTQFKVKRIVSGWKVGTFSIVVFVFLFSMLYLFNVPQTQVVEGSKTSLFNMFWTYKLNIVMLVLVVISSFVLLAAVMNAQFKKPLIKAIQLDKSQIDLVETEGTEDNSKEKFDKYMDEIIYLFQRSKTDVLVIEDLDRFSDVNIFYELRQINFLLNQKCTEKKNKKYTKKKVKFVYMVRDELFQASEERTKFFDIIVPIVPVMDNSNSYELLKKMMGEEWLKKLDKTYLKTICLHIRDYRILKNIYNEFQIYYYQLRIEERQYEPMKLFAMITYKNLWPADYAELQQGKGSVFKALDEIGNLRDLKIKKLKLDIDDLREEEKATQEEWTESLDELDAIFFQKYFNNNSAGFYVIDGKNEYDFASRKEFIHALKEADTAEWRTCNDYSYPRSTSVSKEKIEKYFADLNGDEEYAVRKRRLQARTENGTSYLKEKMEEKEQEIRNVGEAQVKELTADGFPENISSLFPTEMEIIKVFLQDEMIAADYADYMTYFYPYSITDEERKYLNKVFARTNDEEQAEIEIVHPALVIEHLKPGDWNSVALPNKDLYQYLVKQEGENLQLGIRNLRDYSNVEFAVVLLQKLVETGDVKVWVNELLTEWKNFVNELIGVKFWTPNQIMQILLQMLSYMEDDKIPSTTIRSFLETIEPELIKACNSNEIAQLAKIDYKFELLSSIPEKYREAVYEHSMYRISKENVEEALKQYNSVQEDKKLQEENFSLIMSEADSPLAKYIEAELESYLEIVYIPYYAEYAKEKAVVLDFLNSAEVDIEIRKQLIKRMSIVIDDINEIEEMDVVNEIVEQKKMAFTNTNVVSVWEYEEKLTEALHAYLKERYKAGKCNLSFIFIKKYFKETNEEHPKASTLVNELLHLEDFGAAYQNLVEDIGIRYLGLSEITWNLEQMGYIVKTRTIDMTEKNLKLMRTLENQNLFYRWISKNLGLYLRLMEKEELRKNAELLHLIAIPEVTDVEKIGCIAICTQPIPINENYNTHVVEKIFEKDLFDGNFEPLIRRYKANRYGKQFMKDLGGYMVSYISDTIKIKMGLPYDLLLYVMQSESVTNQNKKQVLAKQVMHFDLETVKKCLELAGAKKYLEVFEGHKPRVEAMEENQVLIEALIRRGWVSSYKAVDDEYILYPKKSIV